jgi:hypothetical protein
MKSFFQLLLALSFLLLASCVFVPKTTEVYDPGCQIVARQMELEAREIGSLGICRGQDCVALLAVYGVASAGSAVISGSIVVVGKVVYWFERQGRCVRQP